MKLKNLTKDELDNIYQNKFLTEDELDDVIKYRLETDNLFSYQKFSKKIYDFAIQVGNVKAVEQYAALYLEDLNTKRIRAFLQLASVSQVSVILSRIAQDKIEIDKSILLEVIKKEDILEEKVEDILLPLTKFNLKEELKSDDYLKIIKKLPEVTQVCLMPLLDDNHISTFLSHKNRFLRLQAKRLLDLAEIPEEELIEMLSWIEKNKRKSNYSDYAKFQKILDNFSSGYWGKPRKTRDFDYWRKSKEIGTINPYGGQFQPWWGSSSNSSVDLNDISIDSTSSISFSNDTETGLYRIDTQDEDSFNQDNIF